MQLYYKDGCFLISKSTTQISNQVNSQRNNSNNFNGRNERVIGQHAQQ
jgi:hypothetical protein